MNSQIHQDTNNQRFESNYNVDQQQIETWVETFNQQGCLFLEEVLTEEHCAQLRKDLNANEAGRPSKYENFDAVTIYNHFYLVKN